jgi:hypothetical protein
MSDVANAAHHRAQENNKIIRDLIKVLQRIITTEKYGK